MSVGILGIGAYLPRARLQRSAIFAAHSWFNPGLKGLARGERAMANWDEDSVTMSVEAVRDCLGGRDRSDIKGVYFGSTTAPFVDRQNAGIIADALTLPRAIQAIDLSGSMRAGASALRLALQTAGAAGPVLAVAGEKRHAKAASPMELTSGDGAAAILVGEGPVIATLVGAHSESVDFVDHFRGEGAEYDYNWEERWVRDEGYNKIAPTAISALLEQTGVSPDSVSAFIFPVAMPRVAGGIAKKLGIPDGAVRDNLQAVCGDTGAAHSMLMLAHALEEAKPGDRILVASFGQGVDAMLFEATDLIADRQAGLGVAGHLERKREETRYTRYMAFNDLVTMERGIRAEVDKNTGLSTHFRNKEMAQQLMGGLCAKCGTKQFPKSNVCVNPNCGALDSQEDEPFAEKTAKINSFTADQLTFTPDPPNYFGMVQFEDGGRLMSDFTDIDPGATLEVGQTMRMVFRVKDYDPNRGFRRYFWKATPTDAA